MKIQQPQKRILPVIRNLLELKIAKENLIKTYEKNPELYKSVTQNLKEKIDLEKSDIVALDVDLENLKAAYENKDFNTIDLIYKKNITIEIEIDNKMMYSIKEFFILTTFYENKQKSKTRKKNIKFDFLPTKASILHPSISEKPDNRLI